MKTTFKYNGPTAMVGGNEVQIGSVVWFKADVEQCGKIVDIIYRKYSADPTLTLDSSPMLGGRFIGEYIGGQTTTNIQAKDCW